MIVNKERQLLGIINLYSLTQQDIEWMLGYFKQEKKIENQPLIITKKKFNRVDTKN